jgi:hypothetical protein
MCRGHWLFLSPIQVYVVLLNGLGCRIELQNVPSYVKSSIIRTTSSEHLLEARTHSIAEGKKHNIDIR